MRTCITAIGAFFALVAFADADDVPADLVENLIGEPHGADIQAVTPTFAPGNNLAHQSGLDAP